MVVETWVLAAVFAVIGGSSNDIMANASVLRLLRLMRLTRMAKALRRIPELLLMMRGLYYGIRSVVATSAMLFAVVYLFAILMRQLCEGTEIGEELFPSVPMAMYNLFLESALPDNGDTITELGMEGWYLAVLFFAFIFVASLTILNMLVGVMCGVMQDVGESQKMISEVQHLMAELEEQLLLIDNDFDGHISQKEFEALLHNDEAVRSLLRGAVDVDALGEECAFAFTRSPLLKMDEFRDIVANNLCVAAGSIRAIGGLKRFLHQELDMLSTKIEKVMIHLAPDHQLSP
jgi:hypothetical protein